jgi:ABC-2 type transport system permease protein
MSTTLEAAPRSTFTELSLTNARELVRDGKTMFFILIFPMFFLAMFGFIGTMADADSPDPVVAVVDAPGAESLAASLAAEGIDAAVVAPGGASPDVTAVVTLSDDAAGIVLDAAAQPAWHPLVAAVRDTGVLRSDITAVYSDGAPVFDPLRTSLPTVLMVSFLTLALLGTAVPVVALRQKGTLRLLGTTPLGRMTFIVSQSPARFALGLAQAAVVITVAAVLGYVDPSAVPRLAATSVVGLGMVFAIGYLVGSRATNTELMTTVVSLVIPVALLTSGSMIPSSLFPDGVARVMDALPTSILSDALAVDLGGPVGETNVYLSWLVLAGVGVVAAVLARFVFTWDQGDRR